MRPNPLPQITEGTRWLSEDGRSLTSAEFLREVGLRLPNKFRARLAELAFDHVIDESPLRAWLAAAPATIPEPGQPTKANDLAPLTSVALKASLILQRLQAPDFYAKPLATEKAVAVISAPNKGETRPCSVIRFRRNV